MTVEQILLRADSAAQWTALNPVLALREPGLELDSRRLKIGDGVTPWASLPYAVAIPADVTAAIAAAEAYSDSKLPGKADLTSGVIPDSELPARLQDAALRAAYDAAGSAAGMALIFGA